jgi:hypothetical protein
MASKKLAAVFAAQILALTLSAPGFAAGPTPAAPSGPTAADKDTARALMAQGADLREKNDLKGALQSFQAADAIMHVPSTSLEVAKTAAALGQLVEARDAALTAARYPVNAGEPKPFANARKEAQALGDDLEPRIPSLQITVKNAPAGVAPKVDVDGVVIPAAALAFPRKVNPGHHVVSAVAGDSHTQAEVDVKEREAKGVLLDLPAVAAVPPPVALNNTPPDQQKPIEPEHPKKKFPVISMIGFGVGVAGVAVGSVTGLMSLSKTSSLKDQCPNNQCPASVYDSDSFQSDKSSASTLGTVSTIAFIVGGAGVVVGVVGLFLPQGHASAHVTTGQDSTKPAKLGWISPWVAPAAGGGAAGFLGAF